MRETAIITFELEGRQRTANVREVEGDFEKVFHLVMDDGYENNFFIAVDRPYTWYEQNIGYSELARAAGRAIEKFFFDE